MRVPHFLKSNKAVSKPTRIILFDTETTTIPQGKDKEKHILRLGVACFWHRRGDEEEDSYDWFTFYNFDSFWDWVISHTYSKTRLVLSSHNLSFDLPILNTFSQLPQRDFKLRAYYCKGLTTLARFKNKSKSLDFIDNTNFYRGSLKDLASLVGLVKQEVDFEDVSEATLAAYCKQDVEILLALWQRWFAFLETHNLGKWCRTLPSQAFTAFRHRFMSHRVLIHNHTLALQLERASYHGGRVEVFNQGTFTNGPFYKLDVNSMYPYVMRINSYPTSFFRYVSRASLACLKDKLSRYHVIAHCLIDIEETAFPHKVNGYVAYPRGIFPIVLTTPELSYCLQHGKILECYRLSYYRYAPIFTDYVDYFYPLKEKYSIDSNDAFRTITKGFLNYLYGKFGQRGLEDTIIGDCPIEDNKIVEVYDVESGTYYDLIYLGGTIIKRTREAESYNSFPAIAAEVTANARLYLHSLITRASRNHTFYVDTDSLIVDSVGFERLSPLIHETRLGALRLQGVASRIEIRASKDYSFGEKSYIKGIRSTAVQLAPNVYKQLRFPSIQGLLRQGISEDYVVTQQVKHLDRKVYSGTVTTQGQVVPFRLFRPLLSHNATFRLPL